MSKGPRDLVCGNSASSKEVWVGQILAGDGHIGVGLSSHGPVGRLRQRTGGCESREEDGAILHCPGDFVWLFLRVSRCGGWGFRWTGDIVVACG